MKKNAFNYCAVIAALLFTQTAMAQRPARTPVPNPFDGKISDLSMEQKDRIGQRDLILEEQTRLGRTAEPMIDEQKDVTVRAAPFVQIEKSVLERDKNLGTKVTTHKNNCHAGDLAKPAYDACIVEHNGLEQERKNVEIDYKYNDNNLRPLRTRYQDLERKLKPHIDAFALLAGKLKSIEREIVRLHKIIEGLETCKTAYRCPPGKCTQLQLETAHLCQSIINDGANPSRLLVDPTLASLDPNLPPLNWTPPRFSINTGNKP